MQPIYFEVWMASHFHSYQRVEWFKETLKSIAQQSYTNLKVYFSYSKESYIYHDIDELVNSSLSNAEIFYHPTRKSQFEHLEYIHKTRKNTEKNAEDSPKTFILFCDDDDLYHPLRVECIYNMLCEHPELTMIRDYKYGVGGSFKVANIPYPIDTVKRGSFDFGNYGCSLSVMQEFFADELYEIRKRAGSVHIGHIDLYFVGWLTKHESENSYLDKVLYFKRREDSIETKTICWDLKDDFDFKGNIETLNLTKVFCKM